MAEAARAMIGGHMLMAITREVSESLGACELTHLPRVGVDLPLARHQHRRYQAVLERLGCRVVSLPAADDLPDSVFVEDVAIVLDELAVVTRPGAGSRRPETTLIADALRTYRRIARIEAPGTLDGGDVLRLGRRVYVGRSGRSNRSGIAQLAALVEPHGYAVTAVPVSGCLHLKSAVTEVAAGTILVNPGWVDADVFGDVNVIEIDPSEPYAANALLVSSAPSLRSSANGRDVGRDQAPATVAPGIGPVAGAAIYPSCFPRTRRALEALGIPLEIVDASELQKAEGAVTCCSLVFEV
jgi:dimethylargininase